MNKEELITALIEIIAELNVGIENVKRDYEEPFRMRDPRGTYLLLDVLTAKANAVSALANLTSA